MIKTIALIVVALLVVVIGGVSCAAHDDHPGATRARLPASRGFPHMGYLVAL